MNNLTNKQCAMIGVKLAMKIMNIPDDTIEVKFMGDEVFYGSDVFAKFIKEGYWIIFNEKKVEKKDQIETIITAFHETRHAYQCLIVDFGDELSITNEIPKERIEQWKKELNNPIQPIGTEEDLPYLGQDTELDAIAFTHYFIQMTFGAESHIPTKIKAQVLQRIEELKILYSKRISGDLL